jgi:hypothetical protein
LKDVSFKILFLGFQSSFIIVKFSSFKVFLTLWEF